MGAECYADPKCFWEAPEEGDATIDSMLAFPYVSRVCSQLVEGIVSKRDENDLASLLQSSTVCDYLCGDYDVASCEASASTLQTLISEAAQSPEGAPVIQDPEVLRKLQSAFESGACLDAQRDAV